MPRNDLRLFYQAEEFDLAEFEDYDDSTELFEDARPSPSMARVYPSACRVFFPYQVIV